MFRRLFQSSRILRPVSRTGLVSLSARTLSIGRPALRHTVQRTQLGIFHSAPKRMASTSALKQALAPTLLENVHKLWFEHLGDEESLVLPKGSEMGKWFAKNEEFDQACVTQFRPALETIINSEASASDILSAVSPSSPMDWLSVIILLDQISRNCYRGDESKVVFGRFDPLAEEIALQAFQQGIPTQPSTKHRMAYRIWFHMPLMHSESLAVHEQAVEVQESIARDMNELLAKDPSRLTDEESKCHSALLKQRDVVQSFLTQNLDFEKRHKVIIERFGRYPHRNQALGRKPTLEEIEYLTNGGETFG
ncbi:unnamed protein product [Penicillium salamii]|uniref:DUF924-domain-containing protein n=1 Tax=Penicillium salamii TaxID=1612424 RepID=A0A9W4NKT6_9EURO|nr:unnamed protein product [Penicillium salamii]CAG8190531.1 unnamed protein product [Penicillium salamii]CAG8286136.1 unnamed protein product [Penicillium salamii]CAG8297978.1 unnamed protein product [Penicillium salamii]CAG8374537.1 unnamed protein product [Penicillium salamii]